MALGWELLGDAVENVLSWLDSNELGQMEASFKGVNEDITGRCWEVLATLELDACASRPPLLQTLPNVTTGTAKHMLKELVGLRSALRTVPAGWSPQILQISRCSLHVSPSCCTADARTAMSLLPPRAVVPLALGTTVGNGMCVGLHIQSSARGPNEGLWLSASFTCVHDGVGLHIQSSARGPNEGLWLSASFTCVHDGWGDCMSVHCAPLSGRCMLTFSGNDAHSLIAHAMPPLADALCGSVEVYVVVSESGDIEFFRVCPPFNSIVRSGKIARDIFPRWTKDAATEVFAAVDIEMLHVGGETRVSVKRPGPRLLQELTKQPELVFDAVWSSRCTLWTLYE